MKSNTEHIVKIVHGAVCAASWGILIPLVIRWRLILDRLSPKPGGKHIRSFRAVRVIAYLLGFSGIALGIWLAGDEGGIRDKTHFSIAIALLVFGILEAFGCQCYCCLEIVSWTVIILGIVNVFRGFNILKPAGGFKAAYIAVLSLGIAAAFIGEILFCIFAPAKSGYFNTGQDTSSISWNPHFSV